MFSLSVLCPPALSFQIVFSTAVWDVLYRPDSADRCQMRVSVGRGVGRRLRRFVPWEVERTRFEGCALSGHHMPSWSICSRYLRSQTKQALIKEGQACAFTSRAFPPTCCIANKKVPAAADVSAHGGPPVSVGWAPPARAASPMLWRRNG